MTKSLRYIIYIALFAIPFLALYVDNTLYFPFITGKNFAFRILVEIAAAAWILLAFADRKYRPRFSWTLVLFTALTAWMALADALGQNAHKAFWSNFERMDGWVTLVHIFLLFLVAGSVFTADKLWRKWWLTFLGASALVCGYGLLQMFHLAAIHQGSTRIDASLGNAEYLAGYLLFGIAISLWQALDTKEKRAAWLRYTLFALAALQTLILFQTGTRGTIVGFLGAIVIGTFLWMLEAGKRGRQGALVALVVVVIAAGGFYALRETPFIAKDPILSRFASISLAEMKPRFAIWNMAAQGIVERPVIGWGQDGFNYVFNKYYEPSMYGQEPWFDRAHNLFLDWAIAGGIPALLLYLALFLSAALALYKGTASRAERVMLLSALAAYGIQGLVVFDNLFTYIPFVAVLAMAHAARSKPFSTLERLPEAPAQTLMTVGVPVVSILAIATVWFVNVPSIIAGKSLIVAVSPTFDIGTRFDAFKKSIDTHGFPTQEIREQLIQFTASVAQASNITNDVKTEVATYAVDQMHQELAQAPKDARLHLQLAMMYRSIGDFDSSKKESAIARELAPTKQGVIVEQGIEALQSGDAKTANEFFQEAYLLKKDSDELAGYAAGGKILTNDVAGGKAILMEKFGTTTVDQSILLLAYFQRKDWNDLIPLLVLRAKNLGDITSTFQLAATYQQAGRAAEAVRVVQDYVKLHPEDASQAAAFLSQPVVVQQ